MRRGLLALVLLAAALAGCTSGGDGDSLPADAEASGWTVTVTYPNETQRQYTVTSDPSQADTDGDGLDDFRELEQATDPRALDTDEDRLADGSTLCPEEGSEQEDRARDADLLEHPEEPGCYLGEERTRIGDFSYRASPTDAHSDSSPQLTDTLDDGTEVEGWEVELADGESFHVRSNPGLENADTDTDGLHDGLEKLLATDPGEEDTDGDGVNDQRDAAPLGDLTVSAHVVSVNLKQDKRLGGGADLFVRVQTGQLEAAKGPTHIEQGDNQLDWSMELDVSDDGSGLTEELGGSYASGNWAKEIRFAFFHDTDSGDREPLEVRSGDRNPHRLVLTYDAFEDRWEGHASGGTSGGPDADVTIDVTSRIE